MSGADRERGGQVGRGGCGEAGQELRVRGDLGVEVEPAAGDRAQGVLRGCGDGGDRTWSQGRAAAQEDHLRQGLQFLAQGRRGVDQDLLEGDHRRGTGFDGNVFGDLDGADHSTVPSALLGIAVAWPARDGPSGVLRVQGVGLAAQPPVAPVGAHDLDDADVAAADRGGQAGSEEPVPSIAKVSFPPRPSAQSRSWS